MGFDGWRNFEYASHAAMIKSLLLCLVIISAVARTAGAGQCLGDSNGDGSVSLGEVTKCGASYLGGCPAAAPFCSRFEDNRDGTITDHRTELIWEKKVKLDGSHDFTNPHDANNDYRWANVCSLNSGKYCQPSAAASAACAAGVEGTSSLCGQCGAGEGTCDYYPFMTIWGWVAALNASSFAGHSDWRIPTFKELKQILDATDATPPLTNVAFDGSQCGASCGDVADASCSCTVSDYYWSASMSVSSLTDVQLVNFFDGAVISGLEFSDYVRAVRTP